jgi:thioredoxin
MSLASAGFRDEIASTSKGAPMVRAHWNGMVIAESDDTVVIDGNHYFPADAVDQAVLVPSSTTTVCPWKGRASYYSVVVDGTVNRDAAWYYPTPSTAASAIAGRVAFWHGVKIEDEGRRPGRRLFDRFRSPLPARPVSHPADATTSAGRPAGSVELDDATFFATVDGQPAVVDFWAPWCAPCRAFHPDFERAAADHADDGVRFARVDVDTSAGVATAFQIMSIPTVIVLDRFGHEIDRQVGVPSRRRLDQMIRHAEAMVAGAGERGVA